MKLVILNPNLTGRLEMIRSVAPSADVTYVSDEPVNDHTTVLCEETCNRGFVLDSLSRTVNWIVIACESINCLNETVTNQASHVLYSGLSKRETFYVKTRMSHAQVVEFTPNVGT